MIELNSTKNMKISFVADSDTKFLSCRILLKQMQTLWLREVVEDVNEDLHHQNKELVLPFHVDLAVNIDIHFLVNYCSSTAP